MLVVKNGPVGWNGLILIFNSVFGPVHKAAVGLDGPDGGTVEDGQEEHQEADHLHIIVGQGVLHENVQRCFGMFSIMKNEIFCIFYQAN